MSGVPYAPLLIAEYVNGEDEKDSAVAGLDREVEGYYVQLSSRLTQLLELAVRFSQWDNDTDKADNQKTYTSVGLALHPWEHLQFKVEYQNREEEGPEKDDNFTAFQVVADW